MKRSIVMAAALGTVLLGVMSAHGQQVVGSTQLGVAVVELRGVSVGWGGPRQILGCTIHHDKGEGRGKADDNIISPGKGVSPAILGARGVLPGRERDVA